MTVAPAAGLPSTVIVPRTSPVVAAKAGAVKAQCQEDGDERRNESETWISSDREKSERSSARLRASASDRDRRRTSEAAPRTEADCDASAGLRARARVPDGRSGARREARACAMTAPARTSTTRRGEQPRRARMRRPEARTTAMRRRAGMMRFDRLGQADTTARWPAGAGEAGKPFAQPGRQDAAVGTCGRLRSTPSAKEEHEAQGPRRARACTSAA